MPTEPRVITGGWPVKLARFQFWVNYPFKERGSWKMAGLTIITSLLFSSPAMQPDRCLCSGPGFSRWLTLSVTAAFRPVKSCWIVTEGVIWPEESTNNASVMNDQFLVATLSCWHYTHDSDGVCLLLANHVAKGEFKIVVCSSQTIITSVSYQSSSSHWWTCCTLLHPDRLTSVPPVPSLWLSSWGSKFHWPREQCGHF